MKWLRRLAIPACVALAITLAVLGCLHLRSLPRYQVELEVMELEIGSSWVEERFVESLREGVGLQGTRSIFEGNLLAEVASVTGHNPWIRRVVRAQRQHPSQVELIVELAEPAAAVHQDSAYYLVDREGVRLPGVFDETPDVGYRLPVLAGIEAVPLPEPGRTWNAGGLEDGFAVADLLWKHDVLDKVVIHEIDVSFDDRYQDRVIHLIAGVHNTRVHWGKSPLRPDPADVEVVKKLENLDQILAYSPGLAGLVAASISGQMASVTEAPAPLASRGPESR